MDLKLHNETVLRAYKRADELEPKLAAILEPILRHAGVKAANAFQQNATNFLTASLVARADIGARSAMVALYPRPEEAAALAEEGGEEPASMHVTLAYLGEIDPAMIDSIGAALRLVAAGHAPLEGTAGGTGAFKDNGNGVPAIVLPDVPGLVELRMEVCEALLAAQIDYGRNHGYQPHLTIAYRDAEDDSPPDRANLGLPLHFDSLRVVMGDETMLDYPLTGVRALTADAEPPVNWASPAPDEIMDVEALIAQVVDKTRGIRENMIRSVMTTMLNSVGIGFDISNPLANAVLTQTGSQIGGIAQTTQLDVMKIIRAAHEHGFSIPETSRLIKRSMETSSFVRARLIARTELAAASNGGSLAATQIVSATTGTDYFKEWRTAPGAKHPRHENYEGLNGETRRLQDTFRVGQSQLLHPGDPNGPPGEVCNCRCAMTYTDNASALDHV